MINDVKIIICNVLQLGKRGDLLNKDSRLLGDIPEFDSMAVIAIITALEDRYGFTIEDDEISADTFLSLGSLTDFIIEKIGR